MTLRIAIVMTAALAACARQPQPAPVPVRPPVTFRILGNASPSDTGPPELRLSGQRVTIRGLGIQVEGGGLYGDVDLTEAHTLRLTLYDSIPGRPVADPPPRPTYRQVIYEALIGPLAPGPYDVWVGRFDAKGQMVEVAHAPLRIEVPAPVRDTTQPGDAE